MRMCKCVHNQIRHYVYDDSFYGSVIKWYGKCMDCSCNGFVENSNMKANRFIVCCSGDMEQDPPSSYGRRAPDDVYMMAGFRKKYTFEDATIEAERLAAKFVNAKFYVAELKTISTTSRPVVTKEFV